MKRRVVGVAVGALIVSSGVAWADDSEVRELYKQLQMLTERVQSLEARLQEAKSKEHAVTTAAAKAPVVAIYSTEKDGAKNSLRTYATLRPTLGRIDEAGSKVTDVRDALSHVGFKATREIMDGWTAEVQGEWGIDLSNNGDFGNARRAYVAVDSPYGRVGIGRQRPTQYLFIAEPVDIFNHGSSPFAYDPESVFFVDNLLSYRFEHGPLTFMAVSQFDGEAGDNNSDMTNVGLSYDQGGWHMALTHLNEDAVDAGNVVGNDDVWAGSLAYTFDGGTYLALGYQERDYSRDLGDRDGHTLDISLAYPLGDQYRLKLGYFDFDDGLNDVTSREFEGFNTTLEWQPKPKLRFHLEYLSRDFQQQPDFDSLSVGFRYDLSETWYY